LSIEDRPTARTTQARATQLVAISAQIHLVSRQLEETESSITTNNAASSLSSSPDQPAAAVLKAKNLKVLKIGTRPLFLFSTMAGPNLELFKVGDSTWTE
jgi:hypothetical protein